ncbi:MAG: hypothetical protein JWO63_1364, partial [Frankiales bacterium]|nr:hypothetical protein [Frankiales bacterium]
AIQATVDAADEAGWEATSVGLAKILDSADMREGVAAFLAKRTPNWPGA